MSASEPLYTYTIGFDTSGVKELQEEIEYNEKQLDNYKKQIKELEGVLKTLTKANGVGSDSYKKVSKELEVARSEAEKYQNTITKLKGTSTYAFGEMQKSFMKLIKTIGLFAVVRGTIQKSLNFYEEAEQLDFLAEKTGIAAEKLQELGNASKRYGGTTESTAMSIENIRTNKEEYAKAGIKIEQDPTKTLENVAKKMSKLKSDTEKWRLAESLGIDEATTRTLIDGVEKYNEALKKSAKYKLYTKEDIARMRDYRQIQQDIRDGTNNIFGAIYRLLLPAITAVSKVIRSITDWLAEHEGAVKIVATLAIIAVAIGSVITVVKALNAAFLFLAANPVVLTIMAIVAAITALYLIIDDFVGFLQGKSSVTGRILKALGADVDVVRKNFINLFNAIKGLSDGSIKSLDDLMAKVGDIGKSIMALWKSLPEPLKKIIGMSNPLTAGYTAITTGKQIIENYNNNPTNAVPAGSQSTYYNSQSQNETNTKNSKNIANNNNKNIHVGQIHVKIPEGMTEEQVRRIFSGTLDSLDNGQIG